MAGSNGVQLRVNLKTLAILAAVALPLLLADVFYVLDQSRAALDATAGDHLTTIAEVTASQISRFVHAKIVEVGLLAAEGELRQAVEEANQGYHGLSQEMIRQRLLERERDWETPKATDTAAHLLASPVSAYLRDYLTINMSVKRLVLTRNISRILFTRPSILTTRYRVVRAAYPQPRTGILSRLLIWLCTGRGLHCHFHC